jgi:hypothetical protein
LVTTTYEFSLAGGAVTDKAGRDVITLGAGAATVTASLGQDTILAGSGPVSVNASADALSMDFTLGSGAATINGGTGPILLSKGLAAAG